jgi:competence ComEA-like helix-hairpin-helix protein
MHPMPRRVSLAAAVAAFSAGLAGLAGVRVHTAGPADRLPIESRTQDPPKEVRTLTRVCGACHSPERIVAARKTRSQWDEVMEKMIAKGAMISDADYEVLMPYLVGTYGRVNVNQCTTDDLVEVLGITTQAAEDVLKYRKAHGNFADFDALAKVPGLDLKRLDTLRDAISF